uniref:Crustacean hyperglycemic hormone 2 n=1 Tax=Nephrops norvegicus TaxID=6829 RepID=A0A4D6BM49_NEPNO|nr:crustacean hyperglycemic hormone 2 [Nephrops norvegicus]
MMACRTLCLVVVMVAALWTSGVGGRSVEGASRMEKLLSSSNSPSSTPLGFLSQSQEHSVNKRQVFDQACKGVYDRNLFKKLDRVCEDCYNLYRKPFVATTCRENCYSNRVFRQCLDDLLLIDVIDEYVSSVQMVGK